MIKRFYNINLRFYPYQRQYKLIQPNTFLNIQAKQFSCTDEPGPPDIAQKMKDKLREHFKNDGDHITVQDDGSGQKVHIFVISDQFKGQLPIMRHRKINEILANEIKQIHAVTIDAKTKE